MKLKFGLGAATVILLLGSSTAFAADAATESLYKAKCAACHGADGTGSTPAGKKLGAHDFHSPEVMKQTDAQLLETVSKSKNKMPAYDGKVTADQMKSLVAYVRELGKAK
jgi:cytochrome c6